MFARMDHYVFVLVGEARLSSQGHARAISPPCRRTAPRTNLVARDGADLVARHGLDPVVEHAVPMSIGNPNAANGEKAHHTQIP